MDTEATHLRELIKDLQDKLERSTKGFQKLSKEVSEGIASIDEGQALEARGDLAAALEEAEETLELLSDDS